MNRLLLISVFVGIFIGLVFTGAAIAFGLKINSPLFLSAVVGGVSGAVAVFVAKRK
jgi:hypothetical protein